VSVEGLVLEKMMVLDESDDAVVLKNTRYDVDDVGDRGDVGDAGDDRGDRVEDKPGDGIKRFSYRELITQRGAGKQLMILRFSRCIEVVDVDTVSVIVIIITIIITLLLLISIISIIIIVIIKSIIIIIIIIIILLLLLSFYYYYFYYYYFIIINIIYYHDKVGMDGTPKEVCSAASSVFYSGTYYSLVPVINAPCYPLQLTQHNIHIIINHNPVMNSMPNMQPMMDLIPIVMYS